MKCKVSHSRSPARRRSTRRRRSVSRRRSVARRRSVSRRRSSAKRKAPRIKPYNTTSVCGHNRKSECDGPMCTWARNIGCRKTPLYDASVEAPVASAPSPAPSSTLMSAEEFAAINARQRALQGSNPYKAPSAMANWLYKNKGCHSYSKDDCVTKSDGMCEYDSQVNKCVPDPKSTGWGTMAGDVKLRREALDEYYRKPNHVSDVITNDWWEKNATCKYSKADCNSKSDGKCKFDDELMQCMPNLEANWGDKYDDIKKEHDYLTKYFSTGQM